MRSEDLLRKAFDEARALRDSVSRTRDDAEWMNVVAIDVLRDAEQTLTPPVEESPSPA